MAIVQLSARTAAELKKEQRIKIGWVNCRIRQRVVVAQCFRGLGLCHVATNAKDPYRSNFCFKYGESDHKAKACETLEECFMCALKGFEPHNHISGSKGWRAYRNALEEVSKLAR